MEVFKDNAGAVALITETAAVRGYSSIEEYVEDLAITDANKIKRNIIYKGQAQIVADAHIKTNKQKTAEALPE